MTHPLASFVAGVQGGIQFKNGLKDRKADRARQERMDEITFAREAREADNYAYTQSERNRERGLREAATADATAAYDATQASIAADGTVIAPGQPDMSVSTSGAQPQPAIPGGPPPGTAAAGVAREMGLEIPEPAMDRAAGVMQATMPAESLTPAQTGTPAVARPGPTQEAASRIARQAQFEPQGGRDPARKPMTMQEMLQAARDRSLAMAQGKPVPEPRRGSQQVLADEREASQQRAEENRLNNPALKPAFYPRGLSFGNPPPGVPNPQDFQFNPPAGSATPTAPAAPIKPEDVNLEPITVNQGPTKAKAAALTAQTGTTAVQSAPPAAQDAAQAGAAAATDGKGFTPGQPITPAQKKRGTTAFMDRYMEVGAPMVVEGMVKRGDLKGAMEFMKFIETAETKNAMQTWANAAFAASVGDLDGFVDGVVDLYNDQGYFPDGTSIVRDQSKIVKDKDTGQPVGALITFKDEKTGNTWEQIITDDDLMALGISAFAPENAFEYWRQKQTAAAERSKGVRQEALDANKAISDMAIKLMETAPIDAPMTFEEAQIKAAQALGLGSVASSGVGQPAAPAGAPPAAGPPVAYRP